MKKSLITFLLSLSCLCAVGAVGCKDSADKPTSSSSSPIAEGVDLPSATLNKILPAGEGFTYKVQSASETDDGFFVKFSIDLGAFYSNSVPVVKVGEKAYQPSGGSYSVQLKGDEVVTVENIQKDVSQMLGSGTFEDAWLVSKPIDLLYIAEQVNKGVPQYVQGAYILANDIDCKGEALEVIGNLSTPSSYFSGCFTSPSDPETGVIERKTISNFTLHSGGANYVGLFGAVQSDSTVQSSGLFYGIKLKDFTIDANLEGINPASKTIAVGSLVGFGAGANIFLCEATGGKINLAGDSNYFSYAGGLIGYQQAFLNNMGDYISSEIFGCIIDVDVMVNDGLTLAAGGIVGCTYTNYPLVAVPSIHNSIATGDVSGALRSGGIAGVLGQYSVISTSYAANDVYADCSQKNSSNLNDPAFLYSHAGGLVGYAENDSIVHDSFHNGSVSAYAEAGESYKNEGLIVGGGAVANSASSVSEAYVQRDCLSNIDLLEINSTGGILNEELGWGAYDWVFKKGSLPSVNYSAIEGEIKKTITLQYVTKDENGEMQEIEVNKKSSWTQTYLDTSSQSSNTYVTLGSFFLGGGLKTYITADNGYCSYGYFFDEECTIPVPYAYMPTKNITLYVGFYDLSKVAGDYYFQTENGENISITLGEDGYATYTDGAVEHKVNYTYNGERLIMENARLTQYFDGEIVLPEVTDEFTFSDPNFDMYRYTYYNFVGSVDTEKGSLSLYDGGYFTKDNPLVANKTAPTVTQYDAFKGEWSKSANIRKTYTFDGKGAWTYDVNGTKQNGKYTLSADGQTMTFTQGNKNYTATFENGVLKIVGNNKTQLFTRKLGYIGSWTGEGTDAQFGDFVLVLDGIKQDGTGKATITYEIGLQYNLVYEQTQTDGIVAMYLVDESTAKGDIFGYFRYEVTTHQLNAVLYDVATQSYTRFYLEAIDDYNGEWICNAAELINVEFRFDGIALYGEGTLTIDDNGTVTTVPYTLNQKTLEGYFTYNSKEYAISYNEDENTVTISYSGTSSSLERKDQFADISFIDKDGNKYLFDGRSNLTSGGKLTVNGKAKEYGYRQNAGSFDIYDGNDKVGNILREDNHYALTLNGAIHDLYIENEFMGDWAMRGEYDLFTVGYTDLNGYIHANFRGYDVLMSKYDLNVYTFSFIAGKMPYTYYVAVSENAQANDTYLVITEYAALNSSDNIYCSRVSELFGKTWKWSEDTSLTLTFDGTADSYISNWSGTAKLSRGKYVTNYFYYKSNGKIVMYSETALQGKTWYYAIELLYEGDEGYEQAKANKKNWVSDDGTVIVRTQVDSLYASDAKSEDKSKTYYFDYIVQNGVTLGAIYQGEGENKTLVYTYSMDEVTYDNTTATASIIGTANDGKKYTLTLDYSNESNDEDETASQILIIGNQITDTDQDAQA